MVDFALTEEQQMMRDTARQFAREVVRPLAEKHYRRDERIPEEELDGVIRKANALRLLDFYYPEELGGLGIADRVVLCLIVEELAWGDAGIMVHLFASGLAAKAISAMGTEEQARRWLPAFCNPGNEEKIPAIGAFCLTEPEAGSNVTAIQTVARRDGRDWVLSGVKQFITNGGRADLYVVVAQTNPEAKTPQERAAGLAGFVVEKGAKGLSSSPDLLKWGVRASNTTEVTLDNVRVPADHRLGDGERGGMLGVYATLEETRVTVAAGALGIARAAYEEALAYAKQRIQKKPIIQFQAVGHKLADLETEINAARLLCWKAGWMATKKIPMVRGEGSQAKLYCGDVAVRACLDAIQIHGGYGFMKEYNVGRWLNDAIVFRIWEGTAEIQRNTIVRYISELDEVSP
jgi:acyl-CoA dehydrogenase